MKKIDSGLIEIRKRKKCRDEIWKEFRPNIWIVKTPVHINNRSYDRDKNVVMFDLTDRFNRTYHISIPRNTKIFNKAFYGWRFESKYYGGLMQDVWIKGRYVNNTYKINDFIFDHKPICKEN